VIVHQRLQPHLVVEREDERHVGAIATDAKLEHLAVTLDIGEPHRSPSRLTSDLHDLATDVLPQPLGDPFGVDVPAINHAALPRLDAIRNSTGACDRSLPA
jgi:hypothetical protein